MASNYSGNKDAVQSPSPAWSSRCTPIASLAQDSDGNTLANLYQQMKTPFDGLKYLIDSSRPDFAVVGAAGTGFTAPVNTALGGTVTPSGNAHIADGTRFIVQIQLGGAVGVATFKTSVDGGNTYGALQTTAASMTDVTSGITLAFVGTFTALGTAAFLSGFTPLAQWRDAAGNGRQMVDHLGYRRGRFNEFYTNWSELGQKGSFAGVAGPTTGGSSIFWDIATGGTLIATSLASAMPGGRFVQILTSNQTNAATSAVFSPWLFSPASTYTSMVLEFDVSLSPSILSLDFKIGLTHQDSAGAFVGPVGSPIAGEQALCLVKQAGDAHWFLETADTFGFTKTDTGITPSTTAATPDRVTIELHGSGSPYNIRAVVFINEKPVINAGNGSIANFPVFDQAMCFTVAAQAKSGTNSGSITASPVRMLWNRYLSLPEV